MGESVTGCLFNNNSFVTSAALAEVCALLTAILVCYAYIRCSCSRSVERKLLSFELCWRALYRPTAVSMPLLSTIGVKNVFYGFYSGHVFFNVFNVFYFANVFFYF